MKTTKRLHQIMPTLVIALALAGCAASGNKAAGSRDNTLARIDGELTGAAGSLQPASSKKVQDSMLPPLQVELPKAAVEAVEPRFDLMVSKAPAAQVFMALVANTPYSMLVSPDVSGHISVSLKNVTVKEALESIRDLYGYDFSVRGTRIQVQPNTLQTRVFQVNYLAGKRTGASDLRVTASSISTQSTGTSSGTTGSAAPGSGTSRNVDASRVSMASEADFWGELKLALTALVGSEPGRSVILNPMSGVALVKGLPKEIRAVEQYLRTTQLIIERQVMLEAKIVDVSLSDAFQSGVNWAAFSGSTSGRAMAGVAGSGATLGTSGTMALSGSASIMPGSGGALATNASGGGFNGLALQTNNFAALITFLETQGNVQVLSSPRIATINNQKAVLKVGADEFYVTNVTTTSSSSGSSTTTSPTITLQPFFSGISLDVTPQIDEGGNIILHVHPAVSVVSEKQKQIDLGTLGNFVLPLATSTINETDSIVRVQDGNIVAIGGLMKQEQSDERSQVPGLGDAPVVGGLFGQRTKNLRKRELVILIKPTIIMGEAQWSQDVLDTQARIREFSAARERRDGENKPAAQ